MERMLRDVAETLSGSLRFRLWTLRVDDRVISAHLFAAAGGEVSYWLGGFDERWARDHPSMVTILAAAEHAWSVGDERLDLGGGGHGYKYRFADGEDRLQWTTLISPGPRSGRARVILAPGRVRSAVTQHLPEGTKLRIRATMGKLRSWLRRSVRVS
jgi:CelD/BcsL family acetyltransferase involved in cellulose biosynthesis